MTRKLHISDDLALPLDAVTQKLAFLGRTGGGKTYAAMKLAELMLDVGAQVVALDPVGVWHGLRLGAEPYDIPVFGGLHGDIPLEPASGAIIADVIVDRGISAVLDVSQMVGTEPARFATAFAERFFQRKKSASSAVHIFVEECQEFVPQNTTKGLGQERMLHEFQRLVKLGRNFGIGVSLISQRPQETNKKCLNQTECLFAFQMTAPQERDAIEAWVQDKGFDEDVKAILPKLKVGHAHVWSPQWLEFRGVVAIGKKRTADVSSTPKVGASARAQAKLSPVDLSRLEKDMAASIERAKAEDPKELHKKIAERDRRIAELEREAKKPAKPERIPYVSDDVVKAIEGFAAETASLKARLEPWAAVTNSLFERATELARSLKTTKRLTDHAANYQAAPAQVGRSGLRSDGTVEAIVHARPHPRAVAASNGSGSALSKCATAQLRAILMRHPKTSTAAQVALLSGYTLKSSNSSNGLSELRGNGFIVGSRNALGATQEALDLGLEVEEVPSGTELLRFWINKLDKCPGVLLQAIVSGGENGLTKEEIEERTREIAPPGYSITSSNFSNGLSTLNTMELIRGRANDPRRAVEEFFKE